LAETVLHHIADGHYAEEAAVLPNDEVPNPIARHPPHDHFDGIVLIAKVGGAHDILHLHVPHESQWLAVQRFHNVSLANEADDCPIRTNHGHAANVMAEEETHYLGDIVLRTHGDYALLIDQISDVHVPPPNRQKADIRSLLG
jgi:hypothetical protein